MSFHPFRYKTCDLDGFLFRHGNNTLYLPAKQRPMYCILALNYTSIPSQLKQTASLLLSSLWSGGISRLCHILLVRVHTAIPFTQETTKALATKHCIILNKEFDYEETTFAEYTHKLWDDDENWEWSQSYTFRKGVWLHNRKCQYPACFRALDTESPFSLSYVIWIARPACFTIPEHRPLDQRDQNAKI